MKKFKVSVGFTFTKHVDLIILAENKEHAEQKAWQGDSLKEIDVSEECDGLFFGEIEELGGDK